VIEYETPVEIDKFPNNRPPAPPPPPLAPEPPPPPATTKYSTNDNGTGGVGVQPKFCEEVKFNDTF
jgi:hypothetical protein